MICIGVIVTLSSCGIPVPNPKGCVQLTRGDASCRRLFTEDKEYKPAALWSREKIGQICYSPTDIGSIIRFIEEACTRSQNCVSDWESKLQESLKNMVIIRK